MDISINIKSAARVWVSPSTQTHVGTNSADSADEFWFHNWFTDSLNRHSLGLSNSLRIMIKALFTFFFALMVALSSASECNNYNNNCLGCIQSAQNNVHTCTFCPVDGSINTLAIPKVLYCLGICHAVGSIFNKCKNSECISLSSASSCDKKSAADCDMYSPYQLRR